jgi:membrane peptidoglycan carboxypeptidase
LVSTDPTTGAIRALHGGLDFEETQFDLATQGRRQPGSALKPVILAEALERGVPLDSTLIGDGPLEIDLDDQVEPWEPTNFEDVSHGPVDLREATVSSVNTAFAQLTIAVGHDEAIERAAELGVDREAAFGEAETWGPSIVLGGVTHGLTPLELTTVYATFANRGARTDPYLIQRVTDSDGEVLFEHEPDPTPVLDEAVADAVVDILQDVVAEGTGTAAQLPGTAPAGKTGTTEDSADAWFVGTTPALTTTVWVGHPEEQVPMPGETGGGTPAELWQAFMADVVGDDTTTFTVEADPSALPTGDGPPIPDFGRDLDGDADDEAAGDEGVESDIGEGPGGDGFDEAPAVEDPDGDPAPGDDPGEPGTAQPGGADEDTEPLELPDPD